ncbi:hypothetical protein [Pandoravirus japonicus]|uniref:Uncharacterized protein n=1 Tax=Pandoravirus japonicus TaxID=2823154 RepID=A0A811BP92_9VIRU|nr:hypothetical protein [Pandoravirus japonicus]
MQSLETVASFGLFCSFLSWLVMAAVAKGRPIFRWTDQVAANSVIDRNQTDTRSLLKRTKIAHLCNPISVAFGSAVVRFY